MVNERDALIRSVAETLTRQEEQSTVPDRGQIIKLLHDLQELMYPDYFANEPMGRVTRLNRIYDTLCRQICVASAFTHRQVDAEQASAGFIKRIPYVYELLQKDVQALYDGDPAATSKEEVLLSYPGFYAILVYRLAHELYRLHVPLIPRIMTEHAHTQTGIDIHAGATIGENFFIDHGTGIVVGETTVIGDRVKLYQGVTLGAKSFETDEDGNPVKGIKRHPNIGNDVIIYANATILGGSTTIGDHCIIGGSVWLTHSVPAGTRVVYDGKNGVTAQEKSGK